MQELEYLSQLSDEEIKELSSNTFENETYKSHKFTEENEQEILVIKTIRKDNGRDIITEHKLSDYQILEIISRYDLNLPLRFNLPVERLANHKHRRKNKNFLKTMIERFKETQYPTQARLYYEQYLEEFEKLQQYNKKLIKKVQYGKFKGDFKKAIEEVKKFPNTYGFKDYQISLEMTNRAIKDIKNFTNESSTESQDERI